MTMGRFSRSLPSKRVLYHLENKLCRPEHLCSSATFHLNTLTHFTCLIGYCTFHIRFLAAAKYGQALASVGTTLITLSGLSLLEYYFTTATVNITQLLKSHDYIVIPLSKANYSASV